MKIYLLRHASPSFGSISGKDSDRSLSMKGIQEAALLADFLQKEVSPCEVWCSSAVRTCETLAEISRQWTPPETSYLSHLYLASKEILLHEIWQSAGEENLMIIGHNMGLSNLLTYLTGIEHVLQPSELVELNFEGLSREEVSQASASTGLRFYPPTSPLEYRNN